MDGLRDAEIDVRVAVTLALGLRKQEWQAKELLEKAKSGYFVPRGDEEQFQRVSFRDRAAESWRHLRSRDWPPNSNDPSLRFLKMFDAERDRRERFLYSTDSPWALDVQNLATLLLRNYPRSAAETDEGACRILLMGFANGPEEL